MFLSVPPKSSEQSPTLLQTALFSQAPRRNVREIQQTGILEQPNEIFLKSCSPQKP